MLATFVSEGISRFAGFERDRSAALSSKRMPDCTSKITFSDLPTDSKPTMKSAAKSSVYFKFPKRLTSSPVSRKRQNRTFPSWERPLGSLLSTQLHRWCHLSLCRLSCRTYQDFKTRLKVLSPNIDSVAHDRDGRERKEKKKLKQSERRSRYSSFSSSDSYSESYSESSSSP